MKRRISYRLRKATEPEAIKEEVQTTAAPTESEPMVRTQIYLSRGEYDFLQAEAALRGEPMAALIRSFVDEKMSIPEEVWENNPLLAPPVRDPDWEGHEDGAINHDHYIYGCPKKWVKKNGKWVEAPPLPEDYYTNDASHRAYDKSIEQMK